MGNCLRLHRAAVWADGDEWEEFAENKLKQSAVEAKMEVKIRVTKQQLQELLEKAGGRGGDGKAKAQQQAAEKVLAELMTSGRVCYQQQHEEMRGHWRPSLRSIPESAAEES